MKALPDGQASEITMLTFRIKFHFILPLYMPMERGPGGEATN
jgi:hypothetical protein